MAFRVPRLVDDFHPAAGLTDGHAQTLFAVVSRRALKLPLRRLRLDTPDGDFVDLDVLAGAPGAPTVLILHGLEGSSRSGYVQQVLAGCQRRGWTGLALNLRACSGEPNRQAASYSSGDFRDAKWLLEAQPGPCFAIGFSLGGSVLLNLLAQAAPANLAATVAVCAPYQLGRCAEYLDSSEAFARVYRANFLVTLKAKALDKARQFPGSIDPVAVKASQTIRDFDDAVTARLFGFASAEDYYARCSAGPQLAAISSPTLLISAEDDALAPARLLPGSALSSPHLDVLVTRHGGHVGYVAGSVLRPKFWVEERALQWLEARG
jgi:predicted alpha/beta-fold hydrolase